MKDITMGRGEGMVWLRGYTTEARRFISNYGLPSANGTITFDGNGSYQKAHNVRMEAERRGLVVECQLDYKIALDTLATEMYSGE